MTCISSLTVAFRNEAKFDFEVEYVAAMTAELLPGVPMRYVSIPTLIRMKELAGRPRDHDDIQHLRWILAGEHCDE